MLLRIFRLVPPYTGIVILITIWMLGFISLMRLISIQEAESSLRSLLLPNSDHSDLRKYRHTDHKNIADVKEDLDLNLKKNIINVSEQKFRPSSSRSHSTNIERNTFRREEVHDLVTIDIKSNMTVVSSTNHSTSSTQSSPPLASEIDSVWQSTRKPIFVTTYGVEVQNSPGANGKGVNYDKNKLSPPDKLEYESGWSKHQFNLYASDRISIRRSIPDLRTDGCRTGIFNKNIKSTSVIIVFHNEAWSTLLRSVHSILDRSPEELIKEIILVDDASTFDHLKEQLDDYVKLIPKLKVKRSLSRVGLMKARIIGANDASGDSLTFLDAHIECYPGWLEPLLSRIADNDTNVVCPVIDSINHETFEATFLSERNVAVGIFDWTMQFNWKFPSNLQRKITNYNAPLRSPTMAGGLFSIKRSYFYHLGTYDADMKIWGSENIEMSFRIWMCGGSLEIIPCSHVGHIFRDRSPYNWGESIDKILVVNQRRLVDVWLDDYKEIYYQFTGNRNKYDTGNISGRMALKAKLKCKSFRWYLENIYPELYDPLQSKFIGYIQSLSSRGSCLDSGGQNRNSPILLQCHNGGGNQLWLISKEGYIRGMDKCFIGLKFQFESCDHINGNGWIYDADNFTITDSKSNCVTLSNQEIVVKECSKKVPDLNQKWQLKSLPNIKLAHI